jgi:hypothetical protein
MIKVDSEGREFCLPCADKLEIEGVIVERGGVCLECERGRGRMKEYDYNVEFVGNYWSMITKVTIELDDNTGNMSEQARDSAEYEANLAILGEIGIDPLNFAHSCLVTLLLDGESHQL